MNEYEIKNSYPIQERWELLSFKCEAPKCPEWATREIEVGNVKYRHGTTMMVCDDHKDEPIHLYKERVENHDI